MSKENGAPKPATKRMPLRRGNSRGSSHLITQESKVQLEQVLGISAISNNSLSYDPTTETIIYTAGCVCVLYDIRRSRQTHIQNNSKKPLTCATYSSDGKMVVTGESGHQPCVRVWDSSTGAQLGELQGHKFGITAVAFSPNSKVVVSVGFTHDSNVYVWNWKTGKQVAGNKVSSRVFGLSYSERGNYFVTVGIRFVKFWYFDSNNDRALASLAPCENRAAILDCHRNATFKAVVCGKGQFAHLTFCLSNDGRLFSFGESRRVERWLDLKVNDAFALYVTSDHLLCGCSDGVVRVFEPSTLKHVVNLPKPHPLGVDLSTCTSPSCMVALLPSAQFPDCIGVVADPITNKVITLYRDKSLYIWDITNIQRIGKFRSYLFHSACVCAIEVYPQQQNGGSNALPKGTFITGSSDNTIKIWNLTTLDPDEKIKRNIYSKELLSQIYTDDDFSWLRAKKTNAVSDNASGITALAISPHGDVVASGDKSGNLRVHDLVDLQCNELARIEAHDAEILALSFTRPECYWHYLVSASRDRLIHVFDIRNDYSLVQTLSDHSAIVTAVKFVERPNDCQLTLLSCSADKSVRFRTGFKTGDHQLQFQTYQHVQEKSTFNDMEIPNSRDQVITGCQDRQIRTYELSSGKCVKSFKSGGTEDSGMIINVSLDPSGSFIAAAGSDKCIFIHDAVTGDKMASLYGHSEMITGMKFTNDCKRLISISGDGCIFIWRLSNDTVKGIKSRMRGQGYTPEASAETPKPSRERPPSPYNENVFPLDDLIKSTTEISKMDSIVEPSESGTPGRGTPELRQRKLWGAPSTPPTLNFLEELSPTLLTPGDVGRGAPDGGENNADLDQVKLKLDLREECDKPIPRTAKDQDRNIKRNSWVKSDQENEVVPIIRPSNELWGDELDDEDDAEHSPDEVLYPPTKIMSPVSSNKRTSRIFDVVVTPVPPSPTGELNKIAIEDCSEDDNDVTCQPGQEEDEEDETKADKFLEQKFKEIETIDTWSDEEHCTLSPNSKHRQSMSRKFRSTPDTRERSSTPRSKGSSPSASPRSARASPEKVRLTVEEKLEQKRAEKLGLTSRLSRDRIAEEQDPLVGPPPSDFVIHRPNGRSWEKAGTSSSESGDARSESDNSSSNYMSVRSKTTDESAQEFIPSDNHNGKGKRNSAPKVDAHISQEKEPATKTKTKKNALSALGFGNKAKESKKKDEKLEKSNKKKEAAKSKSVAQPSAKKAAADTVDKMDELQTVLQEALDNYDELLKKPPSTRRDDELSKKQSQFQEMISQLQLRTNNNKNMASADSAEDRATRYAERCAHQCADRILQLVEAKLQK